MAAWEYFTSQKQWEAYIKDLLKTNDKALLRAIVLIYNNQTPEEKTKVKVLRTIALDSVKLMPKRWETLQER